MRCRQEERGERVSGEEKGEMGGETSEMEERRGEESRGEGRSRGERRGEEKRVEMRRGKESSD